MIVESTTRTPPPRWPATNSRQVPAARNQPTQQVPEPRDWLPYAALAVTTVMIGCIATVVVVLAR